MIYISKSQKCNLCQLLNELEVCSSRLERTINRFLLQLQRSIDQLPGSLRNRYAGHSLIGRGKWLAGVPLTH